MSCGVAMISRLLRIIGLFCRIWSRALLQKRPIVLRSLHIEGTPYEVSAVVWCTSCICKLQVSFAEYSLFYRAFLQKRPIISVGRGVHHVYVHYSLQVAISAGVFCIHVHHTLMSHELILTTHVLYITRYRWQYRQVCSVYMYIIP